MLLINNILWSIVPFDYGSENHKVHYSKYGIKYVWVWKLQNSKLRAVYEKTFYYSDIEFDTVQWVCPD